MPLSKERLGEIAILNWKHKLRKDGIEINPSEIKREVKNWSDSTKIPLAEAAEFWELGLDHLYEESKKVLAELKQKAKE
jgi:hypothetical protein